MKILAYVAAICLGFLVLGPLGALIGGVLVWLVTTVKQSKKS